MEAALQPRLIGSDIPATIDRYEILQKLASGGMAELFLAKQSGMEGFEKVVVIKRILSHLATDQEFVSMFLDEARIAAKLSHPNVVQIYDLAHADDTHYIVMEYVSGRNVAHIIKKARDAGGNIPVEHVARVMAGVCDGLYYAHTRKDYDGKPLNIIHRDISPQNILVSFAGGVKLVDFGIAKASTQLAQTRAGVLKGKYSYMSPEQVRGDKIDARSDLFAVGIVMYEMLTAQRPFERENSLKTLKAIVQEKPLNPRDLNPAVPPEIVKILSKALEKDPNRRYANAQEMQLALEDWLDRSPVKSNNVRISRYLYDLFDDELNAEGGTLEVQGIGEIIIPTGHEGAPAGGASGSEEVPEATINAELGQIEAAHAAKQAEKAAAAAAAAQQAAAQQAAAAPKASAPPAPAAARPAAPKNPSVPRVQVQAPPDHDLAGDFKDSTDPAMQPQEELEGGASDEIDGATIPVYDLEAYELERLKRHGGDGKGGARPAAPAPAAGKPKTDESTGGGGAGDFEEAQPTMSMDSAMRADLVAKARAIGSSGPQGPLAAPPPTQQGRSPRPDTPKPAREPPKPEPARPAARAEPAKAPPTSGPGAQLAKAKGAPTENMPQVSTTDEEVIPGLGGGPVRPAAQTGPSASPRPAAEPAAKAAAPVSRPSTARLDAIPTAPESAVALPAPSPRPAPAGRPAQSAVALAPVADKAPLDKAALAAAAAAIPLPGTADDKAMAAVPPTAVVAPKPAAPPKPPRTPAEQARLQKMIILGVAVVVSVVAAVVVVALILKDHGGSTTTPTPGKDPATTVAPPVGDSGDTGRIMVRSTPAGCDILLNGILQEGLVTPATLDAPVGTVVVVVDCKDKGKDRKEVTVVKDKKTEATLAPGKPK